MKIGQFIKKLKGMYRHIGTSEIHTIQFSMIPSPLHSYVTKFEYSFSYT
jgi:hypothetical protein